ncbi:MAG: hypothetical protein ACMZI0_18310 [Symbiopectobacterium sp.]|uniref:hypothetical protein n=1 Tax=Symbiopectobacterium sp. TaxID=2952789 RepID=UPI0039E78ABC
MKINELRAMFGINTTENMRLQFPRIACGAGTNATVFSFNNKTVTKSSELAPQPTIEKQKVLRLLSGSGSFYAGEKYILSPYSINDDGQFCYRLALIEGGDSSKRKTKSAFKHTYPKNKISGKKEPIQQRNNHRLIEKIDKMLATIREEEEIILPMHKITHLKVIRNLHKQVNLLQGNLLEKIPSTYQRNNKIKHVFDNSEYPQTSSDSMKEMTTRASNKNRNSLNKKLRHDLVARYTITSSDQKNIGIKTRIRHTRE